MGSLASSGSFDAQAHAGFGTPSTPDALSVLDAPCVLSAPDAPCVLDARGRAEARLASHPCFSSGCAKTSARIHLAVAPRCNIACNYCVRKFDCVNESRPGVASSVLTPEEALTRFRVTREHLGNLTVAGIAGPGDALANWPAVKRTFDLIRADDPDIALCLSTNGALLPRYAHDIAQLGVLHVTVTVNAVDPEIGARICRRVVRDGRAYEGVEGARLLLENQLEGIRLLVQLGIMVKVNTVLVSGINVEHAEEVARTVAGLGAACQNVTAAIPVEGSVLQDVPAVDDATLQRVRSACERHIRQIRHCRQCRSDAVGMLGNDLSRTIDELVEKLAAPKRIAVASKSGTMVDTHFGHADRFLIYEVSAAQMRLVESRAITPFCRGRGVCGDEEDGIGDAFADEGISSGGPAASPLRLEGVGAGVSAGALAPDSAPILRPVVAPAPPPALEALSDCAAVLCSWAGPEPQEALKNRGVKVFFGGSSRKDIAEACSFGSVEQALRAAYEMLS